MSDWHPGGDLPEHSPSMETNEIVRHMRKHGIPMTRENYLRQEYSGDFPENWTAEDEAMIVPKELQDWSLFDGDTYIGPRV